MEYTQEITLDLNSNAAYTTIGAKQGDNKSRNIKVNVTENGIPVILNPEQTVYFRFRKPDGTAVINKATINNDNQIEIRLTAQALAAAGRGYADITFQNGADILSTISFIIVVMSAPDIADRVVSSDEFGYLNAVVGDALNIIYEAEAWGAGTRGGVPVSSGATTTIEIEATTIQSVNLDEDKFKSQFGSMPGVKRNFTFTFTENSNWKLQIEVINGPISTLEDPTLVTDLEQYGITIGVLGGSTALPDTDDKFIIHLNEKDLAYENNAKYYSDLANSYKESIENLTATGEKIYADDFESTEDYTIGTYVWYNNYLYRFINDHEAGAWDENDVIQEWLIDKTTSQEEITNFHFRLPQGKTGNVYYMTFAMNFDNEDLEEGCLYMYRPTAITDQVNFELGTGANEGSLLLTLDNLNNAEFTLGD